MASTLRGVLFWMHLSTAITAGIIIVIMAATGVALAYQRQIVALAMTRHRVTPPANGATRLSLDSLVARATTPHDTATAVSITVSADATLPITVGLSDRRSIFVDPYTGRRLGSDARVRGVFRAIERWHRSIAIGTGMRSPAGTAVSGAANLAFLFLVVSGFIIWWPRRWARHAFAAILWFRRGAHGRQRDWNWHHVFGFWAAPVLLLIVTSGVFMSYTWPQRLVARAVGVPTTTRNRARGAAAGVAGRTGGDGRRAHESGEHRGRRVRAPLDSLFVHAIPSTVWTTIQLRLPQNGANAATASITASAANRPDRRVQLTLDASTAAVVQRQRYADYDPARKVRAWARPIHTGEAGGLLGQTAAALASAAAVMLGITGLSLACRRARAFVRRRVHTPASSVALVSDAPAAHGEHEREHAAL